MSLRDGKFSAAVLAGGRSTRMGADKAFLRVGDELLIERQLRCLQESGADELLISGRIGSDYSRFNATAVYDELPDAGPLAGLASVFKAASCPLILVLAVDMPAMNAVMLGKILASCTEWSGCVPVVAERLQPLAAAYPRTLRKITERHLADSQYSMREFVADATTKGFLRRLAVETEDESHFINWNEPSDWQER